MVGKHGPDPTQWFVPPTPTPTFTFTSTSTPVNTTTATFTPVPPTPTMTATPVPKKKARKPAKKHAKKVVEDHSHDVTEDVSDEPAPPPKKPEPPQPPERKPICNASALPNAVMELDPNETFMTAQSLGALTNAGLQVNGTLTKVLNLPDTASADAYKVDPNLESADLDVDVYAFTTTTPFLAVLDCYTHVVGRPNPIYQENNYQLEIYNESLKLVGSSKLNDPVESVEVEETGTKFYVVIYGVDGTGGNYRLTLTPK